MNDAGATHALFRPARLGPIELRNRTIKCGTNEGMSREGRVSDRLIEWHREFAVGGVGMTTLAYCSVSPEGRTFADQIWMRDEALPGLRRFCEAMHAEGSAVSIQLGHAGWFANPRATKAPPLGPSRTFSPHAQAFSKPAKPADIERLTRDFANAARLAVAAGFDALEIHIGHGYLLSQFLSPYNNRRKDEWGGDLSSRARFPRQVCRAVRDAAGADTAVYAKFNMDEGFEGGLELNDALQVAQWLEADGSLDALQLTGGHTAKTPMYLMRGDVPLHELIDNEKSWVRRLGMRVLARSILKPWKFEEAFFLPKAEVFKRELELPLMLLGGLTRVDTLKRAIDEGFAFASLGRALIREPDLIARMQAGETEAGLCIPCNRCIVEMDKGGIRCVMRPDTTSGPSADPVR
jgi:2,4-dienoyl-CoA reductase-like NADH-dependent reductase (Old Yellow Enzyme family)